MTLFGIAPAFLETSAPLASLYLCDARLQLDARWPWIVLIPRRPGVREIDDLSTDDRSRLMDEIVFAGKAVRAIGVSLERPVEKLNVGALGNITPQLHVHVVGRRPDDPAWPGPVWGFGTPARYEEADLDRAAAAAVEVLAASPAS